MRIIEIAPLENGAHRNQSYPGFVPDGWALDRGEVETENFPFGEVTADEIGGVMTMTGWKPLPMPAPDPAPDPVPTLDERVQTLEASSAEMSEALELLLSGVTE